MISKKVLNAIGHCISPLDEQANNNFINDDSYTEDRKQLKIVYDWLRKQRNIKKG